jgi:hypothetical protein
MLIFDSFPTRTTAEDFAKEITAKFALEATVFDSQKDSNAVDPFPFALSPPIVLVERDNWDEASGMLRDPAGFLWGGTACRMDSSTNCEEEERCFDPKPPN